MGKVILPLRWGRLCRLGKLAGARKILLDRETRTAVNIGKLTGTRKILLDRETRPADGFRRFDDGRPGVAGRDYMCVM